jgi:hypothetical protein
VIFLSIRYSRLSSLFSKTSFLAYFLCEGTRPPFYLGTRPILLDVRNNPNVVVYCTLGIVSTQGKGLWTRVLVVLQIRSWLNYPHCRPWPCWKTAVIEIVRFIYSASLDLDPANVKNNPQALQLWLLDGHTSR